MLKVGDNVRINRCSNYHDKCPQTDPSYKVVGAVIKSVDNNIIVKWPSGKTNIYGPKDLVKVGV